MSLLVCQQLTFIQHTSKLAPFTQRITQNGNI